MQHQYPYYLTFDEQVLWGLLLFLIRIPRSKLRGIRMRNNIEKRIEVSEQ